MCILLSFIVVGIVSYSREISIRNQFISDQEFIQTNLKLRKQLSGLIHGYSKTMADLDSPLEKSIYAVKILLASPSMSAEDLQTLHLILSLLNSTSLTVPDLNAQIKSGEIDLDDEEKVRIDYYSQTEMGH